MSPLNTHIASGHVIIHKLEQPHRFEFAADCKCGFQHHGFAAAPEKNDPTADMVAMAHSHLVNKHQIPVADLKSHIEIAEFVTPGGMGHDQLHVKLLAEKQAKAARPTAVAVKPPTPILLVPPVVIPPAVVVPPVVVKPAAAVPVIPPKAIDGATVTK